MPRRSVAVVMTVAATPEELETLFEDAFVMEDPEQLVGLFEDAGVLAAGDSGAIACGRASIRRSAPGLWTRHPGYVPAGRRVLQARDTALVVSAAAIQVARRGQDGSWRVAICLLQTRRQTHREDA